MLYLSAGKLSIVKKKMSYQNDSSTSTCNKQNAPLFLVLEIFFFISISPVQLISNFNNYSLRYLFPEIESPCHKDFPC